MNYNLKSTYDPIDKDSKITLIVQSKCLKTKYFAFVLI